MNTTTDNAQGLRNLIASLQSMRDRMMPALTEKFGDAFDGDFDVMLETINTLKRIAAHPPQQKRAERVTTELAVVPDGWMLAPRIPTRAMADAALYALDEEASAHATVEEVYAAMLAAAPAAPATPDLAERAMQVCCIDCGRKYGDAHGFPDLVVPHDVWAKISPTGHEGGLLCPSCMCRRAHDAGLENVPAKFTSGPFCFEATPESAEPVDADTLLDAYDAAVSEYDGEQETGWNEGNCRPAMLRRIRRIRALLHRRLRCPTPAASDGGLREATEEILGMGDAALEKALSDEGMTMADAATRARAAFALAEAQAATPPTEQAKPMHTDDANDIIAAAIDRGVIDGDNGREESQLPNPLAWDKPVTDAEAGVMIGAHDAATGTATQRFTAAGNALLAMRAAQPDAGGVVVDEAMVARAHRAILDASAGDPVIPDDVRKGLEAALAGQQKGGDHV